MKLFQRETDSAARGWAMALGGLGLGAALMYVLDPERGKRRRGLVRDKALHLSRQASDRLAARSRDWRNRARGVTAKVKAMAKSEAVSDPVLEERVRAEIGRAVSSAAAVEVTAIAGVVTLSGKVLAREVEDLLTTVRGTRGVREVENRLEVSERAGDVPGLQGSTTRWSPAEKETGAS